MPRRRYLSLFYFRRVRYWGTDTRVIMRGTGTIQVQRESLFSIQPIPLVIHSPCARPY
jgi:hypothetical protein